MRLPRWLCCALLTACGPDVATESTDTGATSTGEATTKPTTSGADTGSEAGGTSSTTDLTTTGATTGDTTSGDTTGGTCVVDHGGAPRQWPDQFEITCGLPPICPVPERVTLESQNGGWTTNDIDGARCITTALRDRTPGHLEYQEYGSVYTLEVLGEQVIRREQYEGLGFGYVFYERVTFLQPPEFFADCAAGTAAQIQKCLAFGDTQECAMPLECPN